MRCPNENNLIEIAAGLNDQKDSESVIAHLNECAKCKNIYDSAVLSNKILEQLHDQQNLDHQKVKNQILDLLPERKVQIPRGKDEVALTNFLRSIGKNKMRRQIIACSLFACFVLGTATLFIPDSSPQNTLLAMEKVASKLQDIKTASWTMTTELKGNVSIKVEKSKDLNFWSLEKGTRMERYRVSDNKEINNKLREVSVSPLGKRGVQIFHSINRFVYQKKSRNKNEPEFAFFMKLQKFKGKADQDLGVSMIDGKTARGFEIDMKKIDPDSFPGTMKLWADIETALPLRCEMVLTGVMNGADIVQVLNNFQWDIPLDNSLFVVKIPKDFKELQGPPEKTKEEKEEQIVKALRLYAREMGKYPQVKKIYPDALLNKLQQKIDYFNKMSRWGQKMQKLQKEFSDQGHPEKMAEHELVKKYFALQELNEEVSEGLRYLFEKQPSKLYTNTSEQGLQYFGLKVSPGEKENLLLFWKLENNKYRTLFGDLHYETLTQEQLAPLTPN